MRRYQQLADNIAKSIRDGTLQSGQKLPSVRQTSASQGISPSTVFEAYYLLEARGLITARARSGYYVSTVSEKLKPLPEPSVKLAEKDSELDVSNLVFEVLDATRARKSAPLGSAFPSPTAFPMNKLANAMTTTIKKMDPWRTVVDIGQGDTDLRRQIALRYMIDGAQVPIEEIIVTNGALEALNLCLMATTQQGDTVLIESPTFYAALQSIERLGLKAIEVPSHPETGVDLNILEEAIIKYHPKACWLMTNFQNPLGSLMPDSHKKKLVEIVTQYEVPLIEDDVYGELYFGDKRPPSIKAFDQKGWVMHCSSFSKCLAPGYRVGWVAAGKYSKAVERLKLTTSITTSIPPQLAIANFMAKGGYDRHLRQLRHQLAIQQIQHLKAIEKYFPDGTRISRPQGGYFFWVQLPDNINALKLHHIALENAISIAPGPIFSAQQSYQNCIRLNFGHAWNPQTEEAISMLGGLIKAL